MIKLKTGKEEIIYLLTKAIEKYKLETGQEIIQNTNRKNYETLAILLSDISNQLPYKSEEFGTEQYPKDNNKTARDYPYRKYDITGGQIKDALIGIVSNPRHFLVDACYIYLYGVGRSAFEKNPVDYNLIQKSEEAIQQSISQEQTESKALLIQISQLQANLQKKKSIQKWYVAFAMISLFIVGFLIYYGLNEKKQWKVIQKDINLLPYKPTASEIDSLEGIWLCYTGSPQARISDPNRYHKVVPNLIEIAYKNGYFTFNRYGASFDHIGHMQFESKGIVSIYSRIKTNNNKTESPRHSLLNLNTNKNYLTAISASWNFDIGEKNVILGIREIFIKLGKGGTIEEVFNEIENASCQCKIIRWHKPNNQTQTFYLKNEFLDSLKLKNIAPLINENSILLGTPQKGQIIKKDTLQ